MSFTFVINIRKILARGLYRNKEQGMELRAGEKPEEKSLRSTLTYFKGN